MGRILAGDMVGSKRLKEGPKLLGAPEYKGYTQTLIDEVEYTHVS